MRVPVVNNINSPSFITTRVGAVDNSPYPVTDLVVKRLVADNSSSPVSDVVVKRLVADNSSYPITYNH